VEADALWKPNGRLPRGLGKRSAFPTAPTGRGGWSIIRARPGGQFYCRNGVSSSCRPTQGPRREVQGRNPPRNGHGKSHSPDVPAKPPNKEGPNRSGSQGEPQTGTNWETGDTAKGEPKATSEGRRPTAEGWREGGWPKRICPSKTCPGHRTGPACPARWSG
jgi:hypothetical protein